MKTPIALILFLSAFLPLVAGHGFVYIVSIAGKTYTGNVPAASPPADAIIREVSKQDPVKGAMNPDVNCGNSAQMATQVADANPGDAMTFDWRTQSLTNWPHNTGPIMTYMASCGSTDCSSFDTTTAKWFKIDELGKQDSGDWYQQNIMNGWVANVTLPSNIMPGGYIVRHEIIALHLATSMGGAEFYPSCTQINIGGSGTGAPASSELVSLPGAYSDSDPGIYDPSVYDPSAANYVFPGPPVAAFVGGSSSSNSNSGSSTASGTSTQTSSSPAATGTSGSSNSSSGKCSLKRRSANTNMKRSLTRGHPRYVSRIMRDLMHAAGSLH